MKSGGFVGGSGVVFDVPFIMSNPVISSSRIFKTTIALALAFITLVTLSGWGFFGHKRINRYAVFTLPPEMLGFYKHHIEQIT